jgi:urease accessory protein
MFRRRRRLLEFLDRLNGKDAMNRLSRALVVGIFTVHSAAPAAAHHPMGGTTPSTFMEGLLSGFGHPVIGPDHLAFILALGILAALIPSGFTAISAFVAGSLYGVLVHAAAITIPLSEALVAATLIGLGLVFLTGRGMKLGGWPIVLAIAGLLHGYAYGEAIVGAESTPLMAYLVGLALVQFALAAAAKVFAETVTMRDFAMTHRLRAAGGALVALGVLFLATSLIQA